MAHDACLRGYVLCSLPRMERNKQTLQLSAELRAWARATQLTFTIVEAVLQRWHLQSCGCWIALHNLCLQLCKPSNSGGLYRIAGMRSCYAAYLYNCISRATMVTWCWISLHSLPLQLCKPTNSGCLYGSCGYGGALHSSPLQL